MAFPAFLDTCALFPINLTDILLRLPDLDHSYRPLWSEHVLDELERNLVAKVPSMTAGKAARRVNMMRAHFPDANVKGYESVIPQMACDESDRHVLAAAVVGNAEVIVTFNLRHFPQETLDKHDIKAVHPDDFLLDQLDLYPHATALALGGAVADRNNPPETVGTFMDQLAKLVPKFVAEVRAMPMSTLPAHREPAD